MLVLFCIKSCFKCSVYILKSIFQYNKKGVLQNAPRQKSRGNHTKKCWQPRLFALKYSCETKSKALRA